MEGTKRLVVGKKLMRKWVAALRSGLYEQGTGQLRNGNQFCCLGVLADVCGGKYCHFAAYLSEAILPLDFQEVLGCLNDGLAPPPGRPGDENVDREYAYADFEDIADLIEEVYDL